MKRFFFIPLLSLLLLFSGCKKDGNSPEPKYPNIVKLTIDGKEYVSSAGKNFKSPTDRTWIESALEKGSSYSSFYIMILGTSVDFNLVILYSTGPTNGLGTFEIEEGSFTERFSGGESYGITSGNFNITKSAPQLIEGTITLNLSNSSRTKTVTGSFRIAEPHH